MTTCLVRQSITMTAVAMMLLCARASADSAPPPTSAPVKRHTVVGDLRSHEHFKSKILDNERTLYVWLPPGYEKNAARYPVLYMHDGENLFDAAIGDGGAEWKMDESATRLIQLGKIQPIIIVGIANTSNRIAEYTPTNDPHFPNSVAAGEKYCRFILEEVKPFIDKTYRTRPEKESSAIAGSSLGALISLYIVREHPDVFGMCGAMSTSLWWDNFRTVREADANASWAKGHKIWLDIGTAEGNPHDSAIYLALNRRMRDDLMAAGMTIGKDLTYYEARGADHSALAWSRRVEPMLVFFFGK
jgi:predicted alpha/beta superfamily hydrolase